MQNKKIQLWALSSSVYSCKVKADLLSRLASNTADNESENENEPDVNDKTFEACTINSNRNKPQLLVNSDFNVPKSIFRFTRKCRCKNHINKLLN